MDKIQRSMYRLKRFREANIEVLIKREEKILEKLWKAYGRYSSS